MRTDKLKQFVNGKQKCRRICRSVLLILCIVYGFCVLFGVLFSDILIFPPHTASYTLDDRYFQLPVKNGESITIRQLNNPDARYTILYSHGNAEDLGDIEITLNALVEHGFSIIAYDYNGYGTSTGEPSEQKVYENILAVYEYLLEQQQVRPEQIIVFGRSLGGGPSIELAAHHPVGGLILEGAFTSVFRVVTRVSILPFDKFENLRKISSLSCPILVIHGQEDEVVPFEHGRTLYAEAKTSKMRLWVAHAGHNDVMWTAGQEYWSTLSEFIKLVEDHGVL